MPDLPIPAEAIEAYKAIQHAAIRAAPDGGGYAYYFYERVEQGRGFGAETHPPIPHTMGEDDYAEIVVQEVVRAADEARGMEVERRGYAMVDRPDDDYRLVSRWFPVKP